MKVQLGDVCERYSSNVAQKDITEVKNGYPIYGATGIVGNIGKFQQDSKYVAVVKDGAGIGRAMLLPAKSSIIGTLQGLIPNNKILPEYLFFAVQHMALKKYYSGSTIPHIYFRNYKNEILNLPNMIEQEKVINSLQIVEKFIKNRENVINELTSLEQARFVEMFGDPVLNPKGWPVHQLSAYIKFLTSGSRGWAQYFSDDGEYFITIKNVKNCHVSLDNMQYITPPDNAEAKRTKVQENDLLISITADLGRTGVITKKIAEHGAYINQHLTCIRLDKQELNTLYVAYYMESDAGKEQFQSKNQSAVKAGLNFNSINSLRLIVPPLSLQNQFADFVAQIDKSKDAIQKSLDETQLLFDSLMQKYFG